MTSTIFLVVVDIILYIKVVWIRLALIIIAFGVLMWNENCWDKQQVAVAHFIGDKCYKKKYYIFSAYWYQMAADRGHGHSQFILGYMYHLGKGVFEHYGIAMEFYRKANLSGIARGATNIGELYERGLGVVQNYEIAFIWYLEAANKGDAIAQSNVGLCYEYGHGVEIDIQQAREWYLKSETQEHEATKSNLESLIAKGFSIRDRRMLRRREKNRILEVYLKLAKRIQSSLDKAKRCKDNEIESSKQSTLKKDEIDELNKVIAKAIIDWVDTKTNLDFKVDR